MSGKLIVFEGIDGSGKGTQVDLAVAHLRSVLGPAIVVQTKDPGGTKLGLAMRRVMYEEVPTREMHPGVVDLAFLMTHLQNWGKVVEPALEVGKIVVSDRWWYSQMAYMLHRHVPTAIGDAYKKTHGRNADLLIFLYGDPKVLVARARTRQTEVHQSSKAWDDVKILARIQQTYCELFSMLPEWWPICVDKKSVDEVWVEVQHAVDHLMRKSNASEAIRNYA